MLYISNLVFRWRFAEKQYQAQTTKQIRTANIYSLGFQRISETSSSKYRKKVIRVLNAYKLKARRGRIKSGDVSRQFSVIDPLFIVWCRPILTPHSHSLLLSSVLIDPIPAGPSVPHKRSRLQASNPKHAPPGIFGDHFFWKAYP